VPKLPGTGRRAVVVAGEAKTLAHLRRGKVTLPTRVADLPVLSRALPSPFTSRSGRNGREALGAAAVPSPSLTRR